MDARQISLNDQTTESQLSEPKCSCYCVCLRLGVFILISMKMGFNLVLLGLLFLGLSVAMDVTVSSYVIICISLIWIAMFIDVLEVIMGLALIISYCVKYEKYMKMYYRTSIYVFISLTVLCCLIMYMILRNIAPVIQLLVFHFIFLFIQLFVTYIVKKDILEMTSNADWPL